MADAFVDIPPLNWKQFEETWLLNPKIPKPDLKVLQELYDARPPLEDHLWLCSSGTSAELKLIALSREALLSSARAVNNIVRATSRDSWLLCLPTFHVGGLGILARAHLTGSKVLALPKWKAEDFTKYSNDFSITLSSLVPSQLRDLCALGQAAPLSLRAIFIGGGALDPLLKTQALDLGYPILETFGMTECCSQIASETFERKGLEVLPIWNAQVESDGHLLLRGSALCSVILGPKGTLYPQRDGFYKTQDKATITCRGKAHILTPLGRGSDFAKIRGENVNLLRLQNIVEKIVSENPALLEAAVYFFFRDGAVEPEIRIALVGEKRIEKFKDHFLECYNKTVLPFERCGEIHWVEKIPRTALGKVLLNQISNYMN